LFSEGRLQNPTICWDIRASRATHRAVRPGVYDSDNVTGADNQQERLGRAEAANWFLAGFIEGEGALCVSVKKHPTCRSGFYVDPGFFLYQHESARALLELAQATFRSGRIYPKPGNRKVLVYEVSSTQALRETVVPFFERYVVGLSCKSATFDRFKEILAAMERKEHLHPVGLAEIVKKVYAMNPDGKGKARSRPLEEVLARILRGHTSDTLWGEDMVQSSWRHEG
jgi:LAGLIDADG endonuclease